MKIIVKLTIDEELLKEVSAQYELEDAIMSELGWLEDSGMAVESWKFEKEKDIFDLYEFLKDYLKTDENDDLFYDAPEGEAQIDIVRNMLSEVMKDMI